ncbi:MAG TPA: DUF1549 domain-containing protein, partial [Planctomycetaceae bacterium]|nr:DUF1549 domain-containing protein [Planctomycetaceae bacterium]
MKTFRWLAAILACHLCGASAFGDEAAEALFVRRVLPLLHEKCLACHGGGESQEGGLDLRSLAGLLKGGDSEHPALVPLQPDQSPLYLAVARRHDDWSAMPPKQAERLTQEQVAWIRAWIDGGAPWPAETRTRELLQAHAGRWSAEDGVAVATSGGLTPEWTDRKYDPEALWAYQPVAKPPIDAVGSAAIDVLVAAAMPEGLAAAPLADRITLIRRATFGLTGLPPAPQAIEAFVQDAAPDAEAFAKVVERLLASPHYGERMAQHWLDVVRYADSSGLSNDYERGNAWRYRDYVVRAFNDDKPYDQFILEQIAGDEIDPGNPEMLIATGFLRMGPWELTGMEVAKVARQRFLDDVTSSVGETFLAHSLQCARCHDHKFDPVPTRDYYAVQAVFATTQLAEREADFLRPENLAGFDERRFLELSREEHLETLRALDEVLLNNADRWFQETAADPAKWQAAVAEARQRGQGPGRDEFFDVFNAARNSLARQGVPESDYPPKLVGFTPQQFGRQRVADKGLQRLRWELERYEPFALAVYSGRTPDVKGVYAPTRMPGERLTAGEPEDTCILIGGDPFSPSAPVRPGVLSVLGAVQKTLIPDALEGRRKAFAQWVASADNPLTTRTIT